MKQKTVQFQAIIFDMDGTMIDNMMIHHKAWQRQLALMGMELSLDAVRRNIHGVNKEIIKRLFPEKYTEEQIEQIAWEKEQAYRDIYFDQVKLIGGLQNILDTAKSLGIPMGIGTAAPRVNVEFILERLNLKPYFSVVITSDEVEKGKPHPEVFQKVADALNIPLNECLVFEDSPTGAQAAANGNAASIIITTTHEAGEFSEIDRVKGFVTDYKNLTLNGNTFQQQFELTF